MFNFVPQFFHMFGDSVYTYHDNATRNNVGSCPLPGPLSTKSLVIIMFFEVCCCAGLLFMIFSLMQHSAVGASTTPYFFEVFFSRDLLAAIAALQNLCF